ncbi:unnamed protein product [Didymodactylos carnosus]|uniref:Transmembrane protein n=1 Tax=Didymodactylos carnosus TaxID=1234261 RepID=A0A813SCG2_9BILA|nr:unnamed protein product [Didymodactylos carnosus]CAF3578798.1 unnamed protein product [Didymodactylos carnosus]
MAQNDSCPEVKWCFCSELCILYPSLLPTTILALIIGLYTSKQISKLIFPTVWYYKLTFFMYGIMMTSAGILHCIVGDSQNSEPHWLSTLRLILSVMDVGLTSNIAISFMFCGLCDLNVLNPKLTFTKILVLFTFLLIFIAWTVAIIDQWQYAVKILYDYTVAICCFIYLITQLLLKHKPGVLSPLFISGLCGFIGLTASVVFANDICTWEGPFWAQYFSGEFIWFILSDLSVYFLYRYVVQSQKQESDEKNYMKKHVSDDFKF